MMTVYSTQVYFKPAQKDHICIYTTYRYLIMAMYNNFIEPLAKQLKPLASFLLVVTNSHPPWSPVWQQLPHPLAFTPFTPFPPLNPHYTIYKDDINNHGLLHPGQIQENDKKIIETVAYGRGNWNQVEVGWEGGGEGSKRGYLMWQSKVYNLYSCKTVLCSAFRFSTVSTIFT